MNFLNFFNTVILGVARIILSILGWNIPGTNITLLNLIISYAILSFILKFFIGSGDVEKIRKDKGETRRQ